MESTLTFIKCATFILIGWTVGEALLQIYKGDTTQAGFFFLSAGGTGLIMLLLQHYFGERR